DLDHTTPWPGGSTSPGNLVSLCRRHHRMKQHGRWCYTLHDNGDITWVSTTGTVRRTHPAHRVTPALSPRPESTPDAPGVPEPACAAGRSNDAVADADPLPDAADADPLTDAADADPLPDAAAVSTRAAEPSPALDLPPF
ncbi:MAG: hypothetical protein ACRCSN_10370, partial [Dermatophilaceae bacterium]